MSMTAFDTAMQDLDQSAFAGKPVQVSNARIRALRNAMEAMAADMGVTLSPVLIRADGDFPINVDDGKPGPQCGHYGEALAAWLSRYRTRTGLSASVSQVLPINGWCWMNHFEMERMLRDYAASKDSSHLA